ncbi:MAG: hypothetical protein LUQ26_00365, partial [Methylococcaceae bacterium]|nr:hypothetical protein [Methylococcaceae bacterium]
MNLFKTHNLIISKNQFISASYIKYQKCIKGVRNVGDKETDKKINLNVLVTSFTPGSAALRLTVGFGAGRGSLLYVAEYKNNKGQTLAKMDGQERFTGAEVGFNQHYGGFTTLGGEETATTVLLKEAAKHIVEL